ncbi:hypothetical protein MBLNU457_g2576t2 [Dothideomycetes sp. NU457]
MDRALEPLGIALLAPRQGFAASPQQARPPALAESTMCHYHGILFACRHNAGGPPAPHPCEQVANTIARDRPERQITQFCNRSSANLTYQSVSYKCPNCEAVDRDPLLPGESLYTWQSNHRLLMAIVKFEWFNMDRFYLVKSDLGEHQDNGRYRWD